MILQYVTLTPLVQLIATNYNPANGIWTDSSGNGNNATYAKFSGTLTLPVLASGVTPNGSSAVDIIATNGTFNLSSSLSGTSGYTVFAYVMPTTDTGGSRFALTGGSAGYALEYNFYQGHQNWVSEYQGGGGHGTATIPTSSFSLVDLAISASGGTFTGGSFRLNGASDGTTGAGAGSTTSPITRVGNNEGGGDGFVGDIAEIDIYNGVLSSNQISTVEAQLTTNYYLNVSATALASSQNPSPTTSNITFTATVSAASGGGTPNTGTVTFYEGTVTLGTGVCGRGHGRLGDRSGECSTWRFYRWTPAGRRSSAATGRSTSGNRKLRSSWACRCIRIAMMACSSARRCSIRAATARGC